MRVRAVSNQYEILVCELEDRLHLRIDPHRWQGARLSRQLLSRLIDVIGIQVRIAEGVDELTRFQAGYLRDHHRQQRVTGDVERHAEEDVSRTLIQLARQSSIRHIELEEAVAWRQGHPGNVRDVPRTDDQ